MAESATEALTFESEEARQAALREIPEVPPSETPDMDVWQEEQERKVDAIVRAEIKAKGQASASPAPVGQPEPQSQVPQQQSQPVEDDELIEIRVKRSELPEELRSYKDGNQILKQFGHARQNINRIDQQRREAEEKISEYEAHLAKMKELEQEVGRLKTTTSASPEKTVQSRVRDVKAALSALDKDDLEIEGIQKLTKALNFAVEDLETMSSKMARYEQELQETKSETQRYLKTAEQLREEEKFKKQNGEVMDSLSRLQQRREELKTSLPVFANGNARSVEGSIVDFCDRLNGGKIANDANGWAVRNRIVNAIVQDSPDLASMCSQNGVMLGDVGLTKKDVQAYNLLVNSFKRMQGIRINPSTGKDEPIVNIFGKQVNFPDPESAYEDLLRETGISSKLREKELIEAERRGQYKVEAALSQRDRSPEVLGNDGMGGPETSGQEIPIELAYEIVGTRPGNRTINEEKMDTFIRRCDPRGWQMFDLYNKALKRLGQPEEKPEADWPRRSNA